MQGQGHWFRELMLTTGERVVRVVGARLEPEAVEGAGGEVAEFHRRLPDDRLIAMQLHRFDDAAVGEYLQRSVPAGG